MPSEFPVVLIVFAWLIKCTHFWKNVRFVMRGVNSSAKYSEIAAVDSLTVSVMMLSGPGALSLLNLVAAVLIPTAVAPRPRPVCSFNQVVRS